MVLPSLLFSCHSAKRYRLSTYTLLTFGVSYNSHTSFFNRNIPVQPSLFHLLANITVQVRYALGSTKTRHNAGGKRTDFGTIMTLFCIKTNSPACIRGKKVKGPKLIFLCNLWVEINFLYLIRAMYLPFQMPYDSLVCTYWLQNDNPKYRGWLSDLR